MSLPESPAYPGYPKGTIFYIGPNGIAMPVGGVFGAGKVPTAQADNTVVWSGGGELLVDDASGEFLYDSGDVLIEG